MRKSLVLWSREVDKDLAAPPLGFRNGSKVGRCGSSPPSFQCKEDEVVDARLFLCPSVAQMHSWVFQSLESWRCLVIAPLTFSLKTDTDGPCMFFSVNTWAGHASILPCFSWLFPQYSTGHMVTSLLRHLWPLKQPEFSLRKKDALGYPRGEEKRFHKPELLNDGPLAFFVHLLSCL